MSKREKAIYKKAVKDTLGATAGIIGLTIAFAVVLVKAGIFVF